MSTLTQGIKRKRYAKSNYVASERAVTAPAVVGVRRPPKFNSVRQRMCDEPACPHTASKQAGEEHLCGAHFQLRWAPMDRAEVVLDRLATITDALERLFREPA